MRNAGNGEYDKPKQLCHLSYHSGTIHTVRFSPNGKWLASGADDKIICIYHLDPDAPAHGGFGSNEPPPVENWKIQRRLIGHDNDVQDLAWSYDSSILVSVGLDSKIVVWSGYTFEKLKTISLHQSHVKGITFDPANNYFATASDDRTIKIFGFVSPRPNSTAHDMVNNFQLVHTISNPFKGSPLTTYFRRCSWSPDGNHIAAANSVNGPVSSVAIINRGLWDSDITLIGHEAPVEVCAFAPRLFSREPMVPEHVDANGFYTKSLTSVIACAGQDKTLTIWNTSTSRPLIIAQGLAQKSLSDLAWSSDGQTLIASSLDGSVLVIAFERGDLGYAANIEENEKSLQRFSANRKGMGVIEDVAGLRLEEISKQGELKGAEGRMGALMGGTGDDAAAISTNCTPGASKETSSPAATNGAEKEKDTTMDKHVEMSSDNGKEKAPEKTKDPPGTPTAEETNEAKIEAMKKRVTITKDGRKRVAPLLVASSGAGQSSLPQSQLMAATSSNGAIEAPQAFLDLSKPYDGLPAGGLSSMLLGNKRKAVEAEDMEEDGDEHSHKRISSSSRVVPILRNGVDGLEPATAMAKDQNLTPAFVRPAVVDPIMAVSQVRLGVPRVRTHIVRSLSRSASTAINESTTETAATGDDHIIFEAKNDIREPTRITTMKRGAMLWQDFLQKSIMLVTGTKNFWAATCEDGTMYVWTPAGRRLLNALVLESQPVIIESRGWWLLCVTAVGLCHVWNIKLLSSPHPPVSLAPVLDIAVKSLTTHTTAGPGVTSAHLNTSGHIIITLTNGEGYSYSPTLYAWQRLSEQWWAVGSQYWNSNDSSVSALQTTAVGPNAPVGGATKAGEAANVSAGIIPYLERHTTTEVMLKGRAWGLQRLIKSVLPKEGYERFESVVSVGHLENRLAAALALGARDEFRGYLFMYAKRLGAEGAKGKVEELLRGLMGGILNGKEEGEEGKGWFGKDAEICGWDRTELLKGVVLILGKSFMAP